MNQLTQRDLEDYHLGLQTAISICNEYLAVTRKIPFAQLGTEMVPLLKIVLRHFTVPDDVRLRYVTDDGLEHYLVAVQFAPGVWKTIKLYDPTPPLPGKAH